jgi:phospholipase C
VKRALLALSLAACGNAQRSSWGLEVIDAMTTAPDGPLSCGVQLPLDALARERERCTFGAGATPLMTLGLDPTVAVQLPIRHVIVLMRENRSFDHLLGFPADAGYFNPDEAGAPVVPFPATTTCIAPDPGHQSRSMTEGIAGGLMNGWVKNAARTTGTDGHFVMQTYSEADLPFYFFLARTFALADRHFAPMASGTYPNRAFMLLGDNAGVVDTGITFPPPETPSLFHLLIDARATWAVYTDGSPFSGALNWRAGDPGVRPLSALFDALDQGTLPNVAFVDGLEDYDDDHPPADLQRGERWLKRIYDHAVKSPQWPRLAMIWVYDEGGGFPDHVVPDTGCRSKPSSPFVDRGVRVPLVVISPWAKRGYVSSVHQDHTAITRFIAALFDLPALGGRDANAPALLELFDFGCGRDVSVPPAPEPGAAGCDGTATAP